MLLKKIENLKHQIIEMRNGIGEETEKNLKVRKTMREMRYNLQNWKEKRIHFSLKKRLIVTVLNLSLIMSSAMIVAPQSYADTLPTDIQGHWSEPFVTSLVSQGVISGYPDGTFKPDKAITSSEFLSLLLKAVGETPNTPQAGESWDAPIIQSAIQKGIIKSTDEFAHSNQSLTREETAYMLYNALSVKEDYEYDQCYTPTLDQVVFDREKIDSRYRDSVYSMLQKGILTENDHNFNPKQTFTRGATCVVIDRVMDKSKRTDPNDLRRTMPDGTYITDVFYPKESENIKKIPFENGKPVIDKDQVIYELKQHRNNINTGKLDDFYLYDDYINKLYSENTYEGQQRAEAIYESAIGAMDVFHSYSYLDDLVAYEKEVRYYIVPNAITDENIKKSIQEEIDKTMVKESYFISDKSLFYRASDLSQRVRGRLYFIYKSPSQDTSFYTMHGAEIELKKDQWYYADVEVIVGQFLSSGDYTWKTGKYTYESQQFLTDIIPIKAEN